MFYTKKPIPVEAVRFDGILPGTCDVPDNVAQFAGDCVFVRDGDLFIRTLEGDLKSLPGDYIIRGVRGEFYSCRGDIFAQTYEPSVEETSDVVVPPQDWCMLHLRSQGNDVTYERIHGVNDQYVPGETYSIPVGTGSDLRIVSARCVDWFTVPSTPLVVVFVFERVSDEPDSVEDTPLSDKTPSLLEGEKVIEEVPLEPGQLPPGLLTICGGAPCFAVLRFPAHYIPQEETIRETLIGFHEQCRGALPPTVVLFGDEPNPLSTLDEGAMNLAGWFRASSPLSEAPLPETGATFDVEGDKTLAPLGY